MKISTKIFAGITAVAILLTSTGAAFADSGDFFGQGQGQGQSQAQGQGRSNGSEEQDKLLDDYMAAAMAEVFGLTVEEVDLRLKAGDSFITIALSQEYAVEDIDELMDDIQSIAIERAATDGVILGSLSTNQMVNKLGTRGQGGRFRGQEEASKINMSEDNCDETCDAPLYENFAGESSMRRGGRK